MVLLATMYTLTQTSVHEDRTEMINANVIGIITAFKLQFK
jgi:hypothetical protein